LLDQAGMNRSDLGRYTTIVMADGPYDVVHDATIANLKRWVREGGTLLVMGRAAEWAAKKEIAALEFASKPAEPAVTTGGRIQAAAPEAVGGKPVARRAYGTAPDVEAAKLVAGAIFAASIDPTHPLGYGFSDDRLSLFRKNTIILKPAKSAYETPVGYAAQPLQSGFASKENIALIAGSAAIVALPIGRGAVVAMPDDPNFRGFWYGGNRVFFNAIFYGRAIKAIRAGDDGDEAQAH
jgi:hypothetical protein